MRTRFLLGILLAFGTAGCGTGFNDAIFQAVSATGRTSLDIFLTDFANAALDGVEQPADEMEPDGGAADSGDNASDDSGGAAGDAGDMGGSDDGGSDPVAAGQMLYTANGCAPCHCADASGGCALSAPGLIGADAALLDDRLTGDNSHPVKRELTADELAQLEAYLASL